jgi:hypothetical protein
MTTKKKKAIEENSKHPLAEIEWHFPENIISRFTTNMTVQRIENEFKVSFFELVRPIILDPNDPKWKSITSIRADCVASIIVTADRLPKFIEVLQEQLTLYKSSNTSKENI